MGRREPPTGEAELAPRISSNPDYFRRVDESDDRDFYVMPRLVIHVDEHGSAALSDFYSRVLKSGARVLDLMSAYRSHLPDNGEYARIVGLGMNVTELLENTALRGGVVQDLNRLPALPFADDSFDACLISFSIQYLTQPVRVLADVARVLQPGGAFYVAYTNRMFPTKAVAVWQACSDVERGQLIGGYLAAAGGYADFATERLVEGGTGFDPLYVVSVRRA
jgi:SAM-dependent methyltransferase